MDYIGLKHVAIIGGYISAATFDFIWSWKILPPESG